MIVRWDRFAEKFGPVLEGPGGRYTAGRDLSVVLTLAKWRRPRRILEMYTAFGSTAAALGGSCPESQVHTFDVCREEGGYDADSPFSGEVMERRLVGSAIGAVPNVKLLVSDGRRLPGLIRDSAPYGAVFVDGDHTFERALEDTRLALEVSEDDAVLIWDDYKHGAPGVMRLIDGMNTSAAGDRIALVEGTRVCFVALDAGLRAQLRAAVRRLAERAGAERLEAARPSVPTMALLSGIRLREGDAGADWFKSERNYQFHSALSSLARPDSVLEVGVRYGYSLVSMLRGHPGVRRIVGIDDQSGAPGSNLAARENLWLAGFKGEARLVAGGSDRELPALPKESFDLVHLDAAVDQDGVRRDVLAAWPLLRGGGTLVVDGTAHAPGVSYGVEAARAVLDAAHDFYFNTFRGWWVAVKRR